MALDQLLRLGLSARAVHYRAGKGRLHRIHHGVYAVMPRALLTREAHWQAAVLACGPGAALSHRSAAGLHGLRHYSHTTVEVTIPTRATRCHRGVTVHRSPGLTTRDITEIKTIACTTPARTLLDLAEVLGRRALERVFDQAEIMELFDLRAIEDQLARHPSRPGTPAVRAVLDEHYIGTTATENDFEEDFLALVRGGGLPTPEVQQWLVLDDGGPAIRADFLWRRRRLVVETDGRGAHHTWQARERDSDRDQRLTVAGWRVIRVTRKQLRNHPRAVLARLRTLLA